jgi:hypothetical protein
MRSKLEAMLLADRVALRDSLRAAENARLGGLNEKEVDDLVRRRSDKSYSEMMQIQGYRWSEYLGWIKK